MDTKDEANDYYADIMEREKDAKARLDAEKKKLKNNIISPIILAVVFIAVSFIFFKPQSNNAIFSFIFYALFGMGVFLLLIAVFSFFNNGEVKKTQDDVDIINEEKELYAIRNEEERVLAEKQFKIHQRELKRYYDLNLSNIRFLSVLGVVLIISGVSIVIGSIIIYTFKDTEMMFSVVGIISGVLIDGIGAFFIKMYTENMKMAVPLHSKLTGSNNLLLANLFISKIESQEKREEALFEISKSISNSKD